MDLILWRHAEAVEGGADLADMDRPLTPRGVKQAARMAAWLHRQLPESTRVLASPALRTQQTAQALERRFKTVAALAPDAAPEAVLEAARWPAGRHPVIVVGHQPTLGAVASLLLTGQVQALSVKKGAVWWLRSRDREGEGQVVLVASLTPEQV